MKILLRASFLTLLFALFSRCSDHSPLPFEHEEGEGGMLFLREQYFELRHRAAPGVDWRAENDRVMIEAMQAEQTSGQADASELFAGGALRAEWFERGSLNQAGSTIAIDYVASTNNLYTISAGGMLWRRSLNVNNWTNLNRDLRFNTRQLQVIPNGNGGQRILTVIGKKVWYSDDEGATFTQSSGWSYYDDWGGPIQLVATEEATGPEIYYTVRTWASGPWAPRLQLYYSANRGQTFSLVTTYTHGNSGQVSMWQPYGTGDCFLLNQSSKLYQINGPTPTLLSSNTTLPTDVDCQLRGHRSATGTLTMYAFAENRDVWRSTDSGANWQFRGATPSDAWSVGMEVSLSNANTICYGEVNCFRSINGGTSWSTVNEWYEYYSNVPAKLHADMMEIEFFRKSDNTEFALISNHGGLSVSYDLLQTTNNLSQTGLNVSQYYDVRTDPTDPNYVYGGTQDQGYQRASTAASLPYNPLNFTQIISGDYGHMVFSANGTHLWKQYPGGDFTYHQNPKTSSSGGNSSWQLEGDDKPNVGWIVPTAEFADAPAQNKILVGGGNINGGAGSYLIELTAANSSPYTITATQDPYNFKPNSNDGNSLISAIAVSALNGRRYVATDDGAFFRKNAGGSWQKAGGFDGPDGYYLYGACILPSKLNPELVWFAGSGYSNPSVWKSVDGGQTFSSISAGLPATIVQEIAASPNEQFLFAATDAGPFVYVVQNNTWYSLRNSQVPLQTIFSVEFVPARNLARFGTHGRGIWDFVIDDLALDGLAYPSACGPGSGEIDLQTTRGLAPLAYAWSNGASTQDISGLAAGVYIVTVTDANGFIRSKEFTVGGEGKAAKPHNLVAPPPSCAPLVVSWQGPNSGAYQLRYKQGNAAPWTVLPNMGNVKTYALNLDADNGLNYSFSVRYVCPNNLQSAWVSLSGVLQDCDVLADRSDSDAADAGLPYTVTVYPNPARDVANLQFEGAIPQTVNLQAWDAAGRIVWSKQGTPMPAGGAYPIELNGLANGVYFIRINQKKTLKLLVQD